MKGNHYQFFKKHSQEIDAHENIFEIVQYLAKESNYFKSIQDVIYETGWSRYLIKQAKLCIEDWLKENYKT